MSIMKKLLAVLAVGLVSLPCATESNAATLYWDGDGLGAVGGGAGTWNTILTRWSPTSGGSTYQAWVNANVDSAVFGGTAGAVAAGVAAENLTVNLITTSVAGYGIGTSGSPATPVLTFSGAGAGVFANHSTLTTTLNFNYTGSVLNKSGTGRLDLNSAVNTIGKYNVTGGYVTIAALNRLGTAPASLVPDYFTLDGGGFGHSVAAGIDLGATRGVKIGAGGAYFSASAVANATTISAPISGTSGGGLFVSGAAPFYSPYATGCILQLNNTANNWDGNATVAAGTLRLGASGVIPDTAVVNLTASGVQFQLNGFNETVKSISGTAGTIAVGANTLTLNSPAGESYTSVFTGTAGGKVVKNGSGSLTLGGSSTGWTGEWIINTGTIGVAAANVFGNAAGATVTINGGKLANSSGTGRTIPAAVAVNLNGDFTVDDSLFTTAANGQILFAGTATLKNGNRTINVDGPNGQSVNLGLGGVVGEDVAGRQIIKNGNGTLALNNAANTYSGDTTINAGRISLDADGNLGVSTGVLHLSGGALNVTAQRTATVPNPIDVTADSAITTSSAATTVDLDLSSSTIGGSAGIITFRNEGADAAGDTFKPRFSGSGFTLSRPIVIDNGATGKTELNSYNTTGTDQTFDGVISGSGSYNRNASTAGTGGKTIFTQANTYTGGTTVNRGTLMVNNTTDSGTGTGAVAVNADGVLAGNGFISGAVGVTGIISPGSSVGTLGIGGGTLNSGGTYVWEVNNGGNDLINASNLTVAATSGNKFTINATALEALTSWDSNTATNWIIVSTVNGISGLTNVNQINVTDNFASSGNALANSNYFAVSAIANDLVLSYNLLSTVADSLTRSNGASAEFSAASLLSNDTGAGLSVTAVSATSANGGQIELGGGVVYYNPPATNASLASDTFTYSVTDVNGRVSTATVTVATSGDSPSRVLGMQTAGLIKFNAIPNTSYKIEYTGDLTEPIGWTNLTTLTSSTNGSVSYQDPEDPLPPSRYYRVVAP